MKFTLKNRPDLKEFKSLINTQLVGIMNVELLILKGHIIIEYALNQVIDCLSVYQADTDKQFTFNEKLSIIQVVGFNIKKYNHLLEQIRTINKARNQIAHTLTFDRILLNELYKYYPEEIKGIERKDKLTGEYVEVIKLVMIFTFIASALMHELDRNVKSHNSIVNNFPKEKYEDVCNDTFEKD